MDNIVSKPLEPKVTTGPLPSSHKIYVSPEAAPDLKVPLREITLSSPLEPSVRVYDTTGPYSDAAVTIDVRKGLARTRRAWVLERGGVEEYDGRPIAPIDNGNVKASDASGGLPRHERISVDGKFPRLILATRTLEGVDRPADLHVHEAAVFQHLLPGCTRQTTGNSSRP